MFHRPDHIELLIPGYPMLFSHYSSPFSHMKFIVPLVASCSPSAAAPGAANIDARIWGLAAMARLRPGSPAVRYTVSQGVP